MNNNPKLIIFDLDGTIIQNPLFYKTVYSQSLTDLVRELKGEDGLKVLTYYRENFQRRGELALSALGIPYERWAERLEKLPLNLIKRNFSLVKNIKKIAAKKIIYTGSPLLLAEKLLIKSGFELSDFDEIIGWEKPEEFPLKWSCTSFIYESLLAKFSVPAKDAYVIGDNSIADLLPAEKVGIPTGNTAKKKIVTILRDLLQ